MRLTLICALIASVAATGARAAIPDCTTPAPILYCQDVAALMKVYPLWAWMYTPAAGGPGATPATLHAIYSNRCSEAKEGVHLRIVEERKFRGRDDTYPLARIAFDAPRTHKEDRYSAEGEYLGQVGVTYRGGWTFRKKLACDQ